MNYLNCALVSSLVVLVPCLTLFNLLYVFLPFFTVAYFPGLYYRKGGKAGGGKAYNLTKKKCFKTSYIEVLNKILFEFDRFFKAPSKHRKKSNSFRNGHLSYLKIQMETITFLAVLIVWGFHNYFVFCHHLI